LIEVSEMDIAQKIKEFIESHIVGQDENVNLKTDDKIFEMGFLDSMFALQLVNFIEENFRIEVTDEDLDIQNFSSIESLVSFVNSKS